MLQHLVNVEWRLRKMQDEQGWPNILPDWCTLAYCGDMSKKDSVLAVLTLLSFFFLILPEAQCPVGRGKVL